VDATVRVVSLNSTGLASGLETAARNMAGYKSASSGYSGSVSSSQAAFPCMMSTTYYPATLCPLR
jgi:hypothetical protein